MKILLAILVFFMVLCALVSFCNSVDKRRSVRERSCDLFIGVILFALVVLYAVFVYGGRV